MDMVCVSITMYNLISKATNPVDHLRSWIAHRKIRQFEMVLIYLVSLQDQSATFALIRRIELVVVTYGRPVFVYEIDWTEQRQPSLGLVAATAQCSGQEELTTLIIMRLLDGGCRNRTGQGRFENAIILDQVDLSCLGCFLRLLLLLLCPLV